MVSRHQAYNLLIEKLPNRNLVRHCIAVEAAMRKLARHFRSDAEKWGIAGLLHDMDWEATRHDITLHTKKTVEWLEEIGETDSELVRAILSHNYKNVGVDEPENAFEWSLYCCDELTGFIVACALILPSKKLADVKAESVLKKFPSKSFAAGVHREQIKLCESKLGIPLDEFIGIVLEAMQEVSEDIGL